MSALIEAKRKRKGALAVGKPPVTGYTSADVCLCVSERERERNCVCLLNRTSFDYLRPFTKLILCYMSAGLSAFT